MDTLMPRAVALFSGGLDSRLAVRLMQEQGIEVDALYVETLFRCCKAQASQAAAELGVRLLVHSVGEDYLELIRRPAYGYGKGANPCVDCRIFMARLARNCMEQLGACVVVTGEVLGQREMSQKRVDLDRISRQSGLEDRLLRPLSARLLAPTLPERQGQIDRSRLCAFSGRGRRELIALAGRLGIGTTAGPSPGCRLAEPHFAVRVRDLLLHHPAASRWQFDLLAAGRHARIDGLTKIVMGRNADDNAALEQLYNRQDAEPGALLVPADFPGPSVLVVGAATPWALELAGALMLRYSKSTGPHHAHLRRGRLDAAELVTIRPGEAADGVSWLGG
jgi:hypothetical protein